MDEDGYAGEYETMDEREDYEDKGAGEIELNEDSSNETVRGSVKVRRQNKGLPRGVRGDAGTKVYGVCGVNGVTGSTGDALAEPVTKVESLVICIRGSDEYPTLSQASG